jgi:hypothetical protein
MSDGWLELVWWNALHMTAAYLSNLARAFSIFFPGNALNRAAANADLLCAGRGIIAGVYSLTK